MNLRNHFRFYRCLLIFWIAMAGSSQAGSIFSRHGIGLLSYRDGVRSSSMGGIGLAITDTVSIYFINPATMARLNLTRLQGDFLYERASVASERSSGLFHEANVNSFSLAIPIKRGCVAAFGVQPYSRVEYQFNLVKNDSAAPYVEIVRGDGGVNEVYLAFAATFGAGRAGLTTDFYFGRIDQTWRVNFVSSALRNTTDVTNHHFAGIGLHLGWQVQLGKLLVGAAAGLPTRLDVDISQTTVASDSALVAVKRKLQLPLWWGAGVSYAPNRHLLLGVDGRTQRWSTVAAEEFFGEQGVDSYDLGFGAEAIPSFNPQAGYLKRLSYRVGGAFRQLPYEEPAGQKIREWTATFGLGLPFSRGYNRIDLAVEIGKRGSLSSNLLEENIVMVRAAIGGSERWFQRRSK